MKELNLKLHLWQQKAKKLTELQAEEEKMRAELVVAFFPKADIGYHVKELGRGYRLYCHINADSDDLDEDKMKAVFKKAALKGKKTKLIGYTPYVRSRAYNELTLNQKELFDDCLGENTIKTLTIVSPEEDDFPF